MQGGGVLAGSGGFAVAVAVIVMLAAGTLIGFLNGMLISRIRMPSFMVTLVALMLFSSTAIWLTQSQNIVNLPPEFNTLGAGDIVSFYFGEKVDATIKRRDILPFVTYPMLIALALAIVAHLILSRTVLRPLHLRHRHQRQGGGDFRRAGQARHHARVHVCGLLRGGRGNPLLARASKVGGRRSAAARCCSTSSARP